MNRLTAGVVAGALGTLVLDAATYADVALRGRPTSTVPAETVGKLAERFGVDLGGDDEKAANRRSGLGALLGYAVGIGTGVVVALVRPRWSRVPTVPFGLGVAAAVMVAANAPSIATGSTDPREWGLSDWLADIVPHVLYGVTTAAAVDRLVQA